MNQFMIPILLAGLSTFIVLMGGLIGGVSFMLILKRIFIFGILMGGLGFILNVLLDKWGVLSEVEKEGSGPSPEFSEEEIPAGEGTQEEVSEESVSSEEEDEEEESVFDYTVQDEEDVEFKPLDESIIESAKPRYLEVEGEKIEYDPKKAAQAIRQLLGEDKESGK